MANREMNCSDLDRMISEGLREADLRATAGSHIANCARCQSLLRFMEAPLPLPFDESTRRGAISARLTADLRPAARPLGTFRTVLYVLGTVVAMVTIATLLMGAQGYERLSPDRRLALSLYAFTLLILLALSLAKLLRPASRTAIAPRWLLLAVLLGYPLLASLLFPVLPAPNFVAEGLVCLFFGLITSLLSSFLIWTFTRRGYPLNLVQTGAIIGALSGLIGILALHFVCPDHDARHVALWHGLTGILSIAGGSAAGWLAARRG
jgi:hypothetical protein